MRLNEKRRIYGCPDGDDSEIIKAVHLRTMGKRQWKALISFSRKMKRGIKTEDINRNIERMRRMML